MIHPFEVVKKQAGRGGGCILTNHTLDPPTGLTPESARNPTPLPGADRRKEKRKI